MLRPVQVGLEGFSHAPGLHGDHVKHLQARAQAAGDADAFQLALRATAASSGEASDSVSSQARSISGCSPAAKA